MADSLSDKARLLNPSRRNLLKGLTAGSLASAAMAIKAPPTFAATPSHRKPGFDPESIEDGVMAYLKMFGSMGNETVRRWYTGKIYAYFPDQRVEQWFHYDGFLLSDHWTLEDGTFRSTTYEFSVLRDIETGLAVDRWKNPLTGNTHDVIDTIGGPQERLYNQWGWDNPSRPRTQSNARVFEWTIIDDTAWMTWDIFTRFPNPVQPDAYPQASSGENVNLVNLTNYYGKLSDLANPEVVNTPGIMFWNGITDWSPWMYMGQVPGTLIYKTVGVKVASWRDIPAEVFDAAEARYPGLLTEQSPWPEGGYGWADFLKAQEDEGEQ